MSARKATTSDTTATANSCFLSRLVRHFGLVWSLCKVRKETVCYLTGRRIMAGTFAYRPVTNGKMRMHRIKPNDKADASGEAVAWTADMKGGGE